MPVKILVAIFFLSIFSSCYYFEVDRASHTYEIFVGDKTIFLEAEFKRLKTPKSLLYKNSLQTDSILHSYLHSDKDTSWFYETKNKKISVIAQVKDTIFNGKYFSYHKSGSLRSIGNYINGKKHGIWTQFHDNGMQINYGSYIFGKQTDKWFYYDTSRRFREERYYSDSNNYVVENFDSLDRLTYRGEVLNDTQHNKWIRFDTLGKRIMELNYDNGNLNDSLKIYENGKVVAYQVYENGHVIKEGIIE
jgi:antitoxin component YwqK of YwqJK toxin-antitoxin module